MKEKWIREVDIEMDILIEREMDIIIEKRNGYSHEKWMLSLKENDAWLLLEALSII